MAKSKIADHKWEDPLPLPPTAKPAGTHNGQPLYKLFIDETEQTVLPASMGMDTTVWGYNSVPNKVDTVYPGPTLEAFKNQTIYAKFPNKINQHKDKPNYPAESPIPEKKEWAPHLLPLDGTIHGAFLWSKSNKAPTTYDPRNHGHDMVPPVRTITHLHGGNVPSHSDGIPEQWYSLNYKTTGDTFDRKIHTYPNTQDAATMWYHDHALGITRLNVYAGLAGFYLLHDDIERNLPLPSGQYDVPILIQDRSFRTNGEWHYHTGDFWYSGMGKVGGTSGPVPGYNPWKPEYFGDVAVVNGKAWPQMTVEPRKYRFRFLNGTNDRYLNLQLENQTGTGSPDYNLVGTDLGLKSQVETIASSGTQTDGLWSAPAERHEVIVDFSQYAGEEFILTNNAATPVTGKTGAARYDPNGGNMPEVLKIKVTNNTGVADPSKIPTSKQLPSTGVNQPATNNRKQVLGEIRDDWGRKVLALNGKRWGDPNPSDPTQGDVETWDFVNPHPDAHSMHVHLVHFDVVGRRKFDVDKYLSRINGKPSDTGYVPPNKGNIPYTEDTWREPTPAETGPKDTITTYPGEVTRVKMKFTNYSGRYVWHCHMLDHEDYEMMRPYQVKPK